MKSIPNRYYKNVLSIDFDKLKKDEIKCLIFDLDNTLAPANSDTVSKELINKIKNLKKDFTIYILSNNTHIERLEKVSSTLGVKYVPCAAKPSTRGFKKIKKLESLDFKDMCMIGDQILTDIIGGNRAGVYTILVDPLGEDLKVTFVNRKIENIIIKRLTKKGLFKKGDYYE